MAGTQPKGWYSANRLGLTQMAGTQPNGWDSAKWLGLSQMAGTHPNGSYLTVCSFSTVLLLVFSPLLVFSSVLLLVFSPLLVLPSVLLLVLGAPPPGGHPEDCGWKVGQDQPSLT